MMLGSARFNCQLGYCDYNLKFVLIIHVHTTLDDPWAVKQKQLIIPPFRQQQSWTPHTGVAGTAGAIPAESLH